MKTFKNVILSNNTLTTTNETLENIIQQTINQFLYFLKVQPRFVALKAISERAKL